MDAFERNLPALLIFAAAWAACCIGGILLVFMLGVALALLFLGGTPSGMMGLHETLNAR